MAKQGIFGVLLTASQRDDFGDTGLLPLAFSWNVTKQLKHGFSIENTRFNTNNVQFNPYLSVQTAKQRVFGVLLTASQRDVFGDTGVLPLDLFMKCYKTPQTWFSIENTRFNNNNVQFNPYLSVQTAK